MLDLLFSLIERPVIWASHLRKSERTKATARSQGLGREVDTGHAFEITAEDLARHCYILGSTGCGKTTFILQLLKHDIEAERSVVVIDLRGDLVAATLGLCASLNLDPTRVTLLDLRETAKVQGFNPLSGAGEPYIRALHLLDVLSQEAPSWGVQLEETLRSALLLLASSPEPLTKLNAVLFDDDFRGRCLGQVTDEDVLTFWERYERFSEDKKVAWAAPVLNKVSPLLAVPILRRVLGSKAPLDLEAKLSSPGHVTLVSLAVDELHRSARMMGSLLVSAIAREMMARVNMAENRRNPVRLYVDEFENMASESFEGLIAEGRRFKLSLVLSHQTLSQLPAKLRSVIRNNVGIQIVFQCGFEDAQTIARELPGDFGLTDIRGLGVGEALVMSRDGEVVNVGFHAPPRRPKNAVVSEFHKRVLEGIASEPESSPARSSSEETLDLEAWI